MVPVTANPDPGEKPDLVPPQKHDLVFKYLASFSQEKKIGIQEVMVFTGEQNGEIFSNEIFWRVAEDVSGQRIGRLDFPVPVRDNDSALKRSNQLLA